MNFAFFDAKPYEIPHFEKHAQGAGITFKYFEVKLNEDTVKLCEGFVGICISERDTLSWRVIDKLTEYGVRTVALRCTGFNNVDMKHAFGKVRVLRIPYYSPHAVAEHTAALLLSLVRKIPRASARMKDSNRSLTGLSGIELYGKTAGIVGTGRIGRAFADICHGFGMRVLAYDKFRSEELLGGGRVKYSSLTELLSKSDIISLHCPLKDETYHIIGADALASCKSGAIIINTSRSALIDTAALLDAINQGRIGGACLDIYEEEIDLFSKNHAASISESGALAGLISHPRVIATYHQGYLTEENLDGIAETTVKSIVELRESGKSKNELC